MQFFFKLVFLLVHVLYNKNKERKETNRLNCRVDSVESFTGCVWIYQDFVCVKLFSWPVL